MGKALYLKGTDRLVARLTEAQHAQLVELLEEESAGDRDYYLDGAVIAYLEQKGCDGALVAALRRALGARGAHDDDATLDRAEAGIEVEWREA